MVADLLSQVFPDAFDFGDFLHRCLPERVKVRVYPKKFSGLDWTYARDVRKGGMQGFIAPKLSVVGDGEAGGLVSKSHH